MVRRPRTPPSDARCRPDRGVPLSDARTPSVTLKSVVLAVAAAVVTSLATVPPARAEAPEPAVPALDDAVMLGAGPDFPAPAARPVQPDVPARPAEPVDDGRETVAAVVETDEGFGVITVEADPDEVDRVEADLQARPDVVDVFVDAPARIAATNDPYRSEQWALDAFGVDYLAPGTPSGSSMQIAVLDTGVRATHPDLAGRVRCDLGADFTGADGTSIGTGCTDPNGHGTHVAGIASAISDNGAGVAGVSSAEIIPVRVLDADGWGTVASINAGIRHAVAEGADVINMSIVGEVTAAYDDAVADALAAGVVVVASAGNNRAEGNTVQYPAAVDGVISVASVDELGISSEFSYRGATNWIAAPGSLIWSTTPYGYSLFSGTSMAAPHVAGIVARYREVNPAATPEDIRNAIRDTATDLEEAGFDASTGHGLIDMRELLTGSNSGIDPAWGRKPGAPENVTVEPGASRLTIRWDAPTYSGFTMVEEYAAYVWRILGGEYVDEGWTPPVTGTEVTVDGLVNGATYVVVVVAANSYGDGQLSVLSEPAKPRSVPLPPRIGTPSVGPGAARVRWSTANSQGSPVTGYVIKAYRGWTLVDMVTVPASARDVRISGLTNGRAHTFLVQAVNALGTSKHSARSIKVTPVGKPGAPRIGRPSPLVDAARVYWAAPASNGGAPITDYVIRVYKGSRFVKAVAASATKRSLVITGLQTRHMYWFNVSARNRAGTGPASSGFQVIPY